MPRKMIILTVLILLLATSAWPSWPARAQSPSLVYFMNGISGLDIGQPLMQNPVDISITGLGCVATNVMFRGYAGPFYVRDNWYAVTVSPANPAAPCSNPAVLWGSWTTAPGQPQVILTYLPPAGASDIGRFPYDLSHTTNDNGKSRFTIVNGSSQYSIDLAMRGKKGQATRSILGMIAGQPYTFQMRSGNYRIQFNSSVTSGSVFGPISMKTVRFHHYFIALVGSATNGYFTASFSVNTYPFDPRPYNPFPWP